MIECIEYTRLFDDGVQPHRWAEASSALALHAAWSRFVPSGIPLSELSPCFDETP